VGAVAAKTRIFFLVLFLAVAGTLFADKAPVTPEAAGALEKEKKYDQAMAIYEEWLKDHAADPRFPAVLRHCAELKRNAYAALELYRTYVEALTDPAQKRAVYREIALLHTLLGDYRAALAAFERAYDRLDAACGADPWLSTVPSLYVACGELDKAYDWIVRIDPVVSDAALRAELNYALLEIYLARRDLPMAEKALAVLEREFKTTAAYPKALFRMGMFYYSQNDKAKAGPYHDRLKKDFPGSLEARAAQALWNAQAGGVISLLADPNDMLGGAQFSADAVKKNAAENGIQPAENPPQAQPEKSNPPAPSPRPDKPADGEWRVQVGSYAVRENAVYVVKDLEKLKFQAEIVEAVVNGKTYYRVFVGKALTSDEAQTLLARLQDAGIGGYLYSGDK
jgi:tetratricopeptide (TPR) repeat protein